MTEVLHHYVCRTHSHTDRQQLWKVMSRPFTEYPDAERWVRFCESLEKNKKHRFFVISVTEEEKKFV